MEFNKEKIEKMINVLVKNLNASETDTLKMRYLMNFYEKVQRKGYLDESPDTVAYFLEESINNIINHRDLQIYKTMLYYFFSKDEKYFPDFIDPPLHYISANGDFNKTLAQSNIFVADANFGLDAGRYIHK